MIELSLQQGSPEWLTHRAKCFNASEAPAMMGISKYMTRSELLRQKATGIVPEVDAETQRRFDRGHKTEAMARPLVEKLIGKTMIPSVATDDSGKFLASSDGVDVSDDFVSLACNVGFEHKVWNEEIAAQVASGNVPESHKPQLDQQFLVFGFEKILFVCSDGTPEKFVHCWYYPDAERIARLRAGWEQFEKDLAEYQHVDVVANPVAEKVEGLPALFVQVEGRVVASNMDAFKGAADLFLSRLPKADQLKGDQDFANADQAAKDCKDTEDRLRVVKAQAQSQASSIDEMFRAIDSISDKIRTARLSLEKVVKAEKENRKNEIVREAQVSITEHVRGLNARLGDQLMPVANFAPFADAIKGLKSLDSMRDKISVALANAKIETNAVADRIEFNQKQMHAKSAIVLFPDFAQVCTKAPDDFAALVDARIAKKKEDDDNLLAAEREKIRAEEVARANAEAVAKIMAPAPVATETTKAPEPCRANDSRRIGLGASASRLIDSISEIKRVKLGTICARLGFTMTAEFVESLGFRPVGHDKNAKLYSETQFLEICEALIQHISKQANAERSE